MFSIATIKGCRQERKIGGYPFFIHADPITHKIVDVIGAARCPVPQYRSHRHSVYDH
jgi:hypothetical protein